MSRGAISPSMRCLWSPGGVELQRGAEEDTVEGQIHRRQLSCPVENRRRKRRRGKGGGRKGKEGRGGTGWRRDFRTGRKGFLSVTTPTHSEWEAQGSRQTPLTQAHGKPPHQASQGLRTPET